QGVRDLPRGHEIALGRLNIVVSLCVAVLAAYGLQRWLDAGHEERRRMLLAIAGAACAPAILWLGLHAGQISHVRDALEQVPVLHTYERSSHIWALASVLRWAALAVVTVA